MVFSEALRDRKFLKWMLTLSLPIALQNLINASVNTADTIMVGQLGEASIASVGLANQVFFILSLILFGVSSGCNVFVAQFWGKRDLTNIRKTMALSIMLSLVPAVIFTFCALVTPDFLMRIFSNDEQVVALGCQYLRIIAISYIPYAISLTISSSVRTIERPALALVTSIMSLLINTCLNYVFIFGKFGAPALGVEGAALATTITRLIELIVVATVLYTRFSMIAIRLKDFGRALHLRFIKPFMRAVTPVILNESAWGIGVAMYSVVYSHMGTNVVAAMNINSVFDNLFRALFFGISYAAGVIVGKTIGEGKEELALEYGKRFNVITPVFSIAFTVLIAVCAPIVWVIYNVSEEVMFSATWLIIITGLYAPLRNANSVQLVGVLRNGGDTKFTLYLDLAGVWFIALPLGALFGLVLKCNIIIVHAVMLVEEIVKFILLTHRTFQGKWVKNLVQRM
ncbi:MAG TPA: MATE family efflux transporter [Candidatus Aphodoplasma excrementigallinarum]|uniref:MATE family efflux transporter n=1 Tax=Candidatus Aphodoplasma excrementigallinarum TaxID=2840673 RepID=A0A9D1NG15_9FIRM|nr:MATE family efflux transporter [Candidatus Aphodoplasma excrementigallinarum]